ncbi:hypothetical protein E1A91_A06G019100v1 [Gossypium mustelinum]|uniref:Uncharacterized protein n=2 Tax=Gossypium TaxID=3633 RepID=A0A5J5V916_GOSBA|nr:hypothetical protein ES319_A06G019700v1 [Gossypium barbadense]TYJ28711.1 hypothetical protein E1A91_A06G019100v1 [Gossypium mustelinum]
MPYPCLTTYLTSSSSSSKLMVPSPLPSAWCKDRRTRQLGFRDPSSRKTFINSSLLRQPSPLTSCFLKTAFNCSSLRLRFMDFGT